MEKVGQNIKYDLAILGGAGLTVNGPVFDTMVSSYLIHSDRTSHGLDHLSEVYLGEKTIKYADLCGTGAKQIPLFSCANRRGGALRLPRRGLHNQNCRTHEK